MKAQHTLQWVGIPGSLRTPCALVLAAALTSGCSTTPTVPDSAAPGASTRGAMITHYSARERTKRYYQCLRRAALPLATVPSTSIEIAGFAAQRCQQVLADLTEALMTENAGVANADTYAAAYGDILKTQLVRDLARTIEELKHDDRKQL